MPDRSADFTKLVPGFDFLQGRVTNAGSTLPHIGQWVAPTLDPEELGKRIEELRTVQFWLEQNAKMLSATIQALEVQRMTLSTLKTMNVQVSDLRESMKLPVAAGAPAAAPVGRSRTEAQAAAKPAGVVDPLQWWDALTKQFTELAAGALKEGAGPPAAKAAGKPARRASKPAKAKATKAARR